MARYNDLYELHIKETEAIIAQSALLLQRKSKGQSGELKTAGYIVERYVKHILSGVIHHGLELTSGYVVNPETYKGEENLNQHDIILKDKLIPPIFSLMDNEIQIVPVQSMLGIIEVKRTLTKSSIKKAQLSISKTYKKVIKEYKNKEMESNFGSVSSLRPGTRSPLFGIIGLESEITHKDVIEHIDSGLIDFIWAFNHDESFVIADKNGTVNASISRKGMEDPRLVTVIGSKASVFSQMRGILGFWISHLASEWMKADTVLKYYTKLKNPEAKNDSLDN